MSALAKSAERPEQVVIPIAVDRIKPSPHNHRKSFGSLDELGKSIKSKGLIVPIKVRTDPKDAKGFELIFGERRWRAAKLAKVPELMAIVHEMSDVEVIEAQLIENLQRQDVHPLEEADGFRTLKTEHGYSVEDIAAKIGKSTKYVHDRIKLCELAGGDARDLCFADKINASIALLLARIPSPKLQDRAAKEIAAGHKGEELVQGNWIKVERPLSYREALVHLQQHYMLRLDIAPFPVDDKDLLPKAGACTGCLYRTGNQRELFADVKSADVCTNPPCFEAKRDAMWKRKSDEWEQAGKRVLPKTDVARAFEGTQQGGRLKWNGPFVDATQKAPWDIDRKQRTWDQLFGGADKVPVILARSPTGDVLHLVDKRAAVSALQKSGVLKKSEPRSGSSGRPSSKKPRQASLEERVELQLQVELVKALSTAVEPKLNKGDLVAWRWVAAAMLDMVDAGEGGPVIERAYELESTASWKFPADKVLAKVRDAKGMRELVVRTVAADIVAGDEIGHKGGGERTNKVCKLFGVSVRDIILQVTDQVKKTMEAEAAVAAAKKTKKATRAK